MKYRVKEFNSSYDYLFGEGKGWIFVTNELSFSEALFWILWLRVIRKSSLRYEIIPVINNAIEANII